jgi:hypothetical protein
VTSLGFAARDEIALDLVVRGARILAQRPLH